MKIFKDKPHTVITFKFHHQGKPQLAITIMAMFSFDKISQFMSYADFWKIAKKNFNFSQGEFIDLNMPKQKAEFFVKGSCYSYDSKTSQSTVQVTLDTMQKQIAVFGDRHWSGVAPDYYSSRPECFKNIPITLDRAFGGEGNILNPAGIGFSNSSDSYNDAKLPNLELPSQLLRQPTDTPHPALFLPHSPTCKFQLDKLGTFDKDWLVNESPYYPADIDWLYFNLAEADQQRALFFKGDETFSISNMHPQKQIIKSQLPGLRIRCFFKRNDSKGSLSELNLNLDTIWFLPDDEKGILIWHGVIDTKDIAANDIDYLYTVSEPLAEAKKDVAYYAEIRNKPRTRISPDSQSEAKTKAQLNISKAKSIQLPLTAQTNKHQFDFIKKYITTNSASEGEKIAALNKLDQFKESIKQLDQRSRRIQFQKGTIQQSTFSRDDVVAGYQQGQKFSGENLAGIDLSDLDLSGINLTGCNLSECNFTRTRLNNADLSTTTLINTNLSEATLLNANLANALIKNAILNKTDFTESCLHYVQFEGCTGKEVNCSNAFLNYANFKNCQIQESLFVGLKANYFHCSDSTFQLCNFSKTRMKFANITNSKWLNVQCSETDFSYALFDASTLSQIKGNNIIAPSLSLNNCTIDNLELNDSNLERLSCKSAYMTDCTFSKCSLPRLNLMNAKLAQINFSHCEVTYMRGNEKTNLSSIIFEHCKLNNWALLGGHYEQMTINVSDLQASQFINCIWKKSTFNKCDGRKLRMVNCKVDWCLYQDINFFNGIFHSSIFENTEFNHCNLYSIVFTDCKREKVKILDCLTRTISLNQEEPS